MTTRKVLSAVAMLALGMAVALPTVKAGQSDELTKFTFDQAVKVPGNVLPAGTYWFRVMGDFNDAQKNVILIFNAKQSKLIATVAAAPEERVKTRTLVRMAQGNNAEPAAMLTWFYPTENEGHAFLYSPRERSRLREESVSTVSARPPQNKLHVHGD
jgi:hypothetical protein